jgi:hypothetical protein
MCMGDGRTSAGRARRNTPSVGISPRRQVVRSAAFGRRSSTTSARGYEGGPAGGRGRRRRQEQPARQRRHPHERDAGVVCRRAPDRWPVSPRRRRTRGGTPWTSTKAATWPRSTRSKKRPRSHSRPVTRRRGPASRASASRLEVGNGKGKCPPGSRSLMCSRPNLSESPRVPVPDGLRQPAAHQGAGHRRRGRRGRRAGGKAPRPCLPGHGAAGDPVRGRGVERELPAAHPPAVLATADRPGDRGTPVAGCGTGCRSRTTAVEFSPDDNQPRGASR